MNARIAIVTNTGEAVISEGILSFSFRKDKYIPYTMLNARFSAPEGSNFITAKEAKLYVNDILVHHGLIDTLSLTLEGGCNFARLVSRGFTSLLCQNQIEPGLKNGVSINNLMDSFYDFPYITHEDNSDTSSYIYVKSNSSMWETVANLSYKLCGTYPFIRGTNCVRMTRVSDPTRFTFADADITALGTEENCRRVASHFHMSDISGNYGTYEHEDTSISMLGIVRHIYFELDKQFLNSPEEAPVYRDKFLSRGMRMRFMRCCGYNGCDLSDIVSFGSVTDRRIDTLSITGSDKGIFTEIGVYYDKF